MIYILIPIYNGIEFIDTAVTSIINQTYKDWRVLIGVNGHEANSSVYNLAAKYSSDKITVLDLFNIRGKSNALNEMVKYINTEEDWIALLDVDDIWFPNKLMHQIPFCQNYDIIGTHCQYFGDLNSAPCIPTGDITLFDFSKCNPVINSSCLIRGKYAQWRENTPVGVEDYDLWLRLWKQKQKFYNLDEILVLHRIHRSSAFNSKDNGMGVPTLLKEHGLL